MMRPVLGLQLPHFVRMRWMWISGGVNVQRLAPFRNGLLKKLNQMLAVKVIECSLSCRKARTFATMKFDATVSCDGDPVRVF
jgi:hypothetical protein